MKIGMVTASLTRQAGGLYYTVRNLSLAINEVEGKSVEVFGLEDEDTADDIQYWLPLQPNVHTIKGSRAFGYSPRMSQMLIGSKLDLVHVHGIWMYPSVASLKWSKTTDKPHIISPRGMLDPWAVNNSRLKKKLAGWLYENAHLKRAACLHALNKAEADAMRAYGLTNPIAVIPNGVALPDHEQLEPPSWRKQLPNGAQALLFLSRIHPKKGLPTLLQAWKKIESCAQKEGWHLVIAGWGQGKHEQELKTLAQELRIDDSVLFIGPQFEKDKTSTFQYADGFILPSLSEGLPVAVLEAWSYGLPVLMTDECNIPDGFTHKAAIKLSLKEDEMADKIKFFMALSKDEQSRMGKNGKILVQEKFTWGKISIDMIDVYSWVLNQGLKPDCVICD